MPRSRLSLSIALCGVVIISAFLLGRLALPELFREAPAAFAHGTIARSRHIRLAVLGDSDSQSYHDSVMFGSDSTLRGGQYRATTYQWTEVLSHLRGDEIDEGTWGVWGSGKYQALFDEALGYLARAPRKNDFRYNFAVTGATCDELMGARGERQALRLVDLMDTEPQAWRGGVVLIRVGINDIGGHDVLDQLSRDPGAPHAGSLIKVCIDTIGASVALIRKQHPDTYIVLVGVLSNADWSGEFAAWQSWQAIANIDAGMDTYDDGLRRLAATDRHILFLDDRAWFRSLWGARDGQGRPIYKTVHMGPGWDIVNTSGDEPHNAVLADTHAGVVWNALWAQNLVTALDDKFGLQINPITNAEVIRFLEPSFAASHSQVIPMGGISESWAIPQTTAF